MDKQLRTISGISANHKDHLVSLLRSRRYREVGILDTPGEREYCARSRIRNFDDPDSDMVWTVIFGNGYQNG